MYKNIYTEYTQIKGEKTETVRHEWTSTNRMDFENIKASFIGLRTAMFNLYTNEFSTFFRDDPNDASIVNPDQASFMTEFYDGEKWVRNVRMIKIETV